MIDSNKGFLRHYDNKLFLDLILKKSTDRNERLMALKELPIAERKMAWMERHANFDWDVVRPEIEKRTKDWQA